MKVKVLQQQRKKVKINHPKKFVMFVWLVVQLGKMKHLLNGIQVKIFILFLLKKLNFQFLDDFRLFCGDLGNEVNDDVLTRAFNKYPSFQKAKVVRDKRSGKTRGYGFVSFKDSQDYIRAMREMNGKILILIYFTLTFFFNR
jgi:hypothetical protein